LGGAPDDDLDLYAEGWIDFDCEIAVMVVRSSNGVDSSTYPAVNAIQQDSVCRVVLAPAVNLSLKLRRTCQDIAQKAIDSLGSGASGMFGVELFLCKDGTVLLNEIAPRPHNTGHYTQDACAVSQFENHLRGICGLPLGSTEMIVEASASKYFSVKNRFSSLQVTQTSLFYVSSQWSMYWVLNQELSKIQ